MARGGDRYFLFVLADRLGMSVTEVASLPAREVEEWKAYVSLESERADNARRMSKATGGAA